MKILHVATSFFPKIGGAETVVHNLAIHQMRNGHDVMVLVPHYSKKCIRARLPYKTIGLWPGVMTLLQKRFSLGADMLRFQFALLQRRHKFDIWNVHTGYPIAPAAAAFFNANSIPCVLTCHGADIQRLPEIGYGVRLDSRIDEIMSKSLVYYNRVIAITKTMRHECEELNIPSEKIVDIPNGIECAGFAVEVDRDSVRATLGITEGKLLLLTVGRNHPKKGYKYIPEIIRILIKKRQDFIWLIVGEGTAEIKELAKSLNVGDYLIVKNTIGHRYEKDSYEFPAKSLIQIYKSADIFVFPTIIESFGVVIIEAMAAGLPVITTSAPGVDDLVQDGMDGIKCEVGNPKQMAEAISSVMEDNKLRKKLKDNAIDSSYNYDWEIVTGKYLELYGNLLGTK